MRKNTRRVKESIFGIRFLNSAIRTFFPSLDQRDSNRPDIIERSRRNLSGRIGILRLPGNARKRRLIRLRSNPLEYQRGIDAAEGEIVAHQIFAVQFSYIPHDVIEFRTGRVDMLQIGGGVTPPFAHHA